MRTKDRLCLWLFTAMLTQLAACAEGGGSVSELQPAPAAAELLQHPLPDDLRGLPALPLTRAAADLTETSIDGEDSFAHSDNAVAAGPALQLAAAAGELSWGIWELPAVDELRYLDIDISVPQQNGSVYIALADYQSGSWELEGPLFSGRVLELDAARHASPGNALYAAVLAFDKAEATVQKLSLLAGHSNTAPTAALAADITTGNAPLTVEFDASASTDPDGSIARYLWDWDGDGLVDGTSYGASVAHTYLEGGTFGAIVTVEDADGERDSAAVSISVNSPPTAVLSLSGTEVQKGDIVVLNGSLSSDSDGSIVLYEWDTDGNGSFETDSGSDGTLNIGAATAGSFVIRLRVTDDDGAAAVDSTVLNVRGWNTVETVTSGVSGQFCSLAILSNGAPSICYYDATNNELRFVHATDNQGSAWGPTKIVDTQGDQGQYCSLLLVNGFPAIAYYDADNNNLRYVRAVNALGGAWNLPQVVDGAGLTGAYLSMAIVNGNPAISYHSTTGGDLKYVRATDAEGTAWGSPLTPDSTGITGGYTSLALLSSGNPAISYYDASNADLRYVRATDQDGTAWATPVTVDSPGSTGVYTSLALVNGNPAISYYDQGGGNLRYVRSQNSSGTSWNTPFTLDSAGDTGLYPSLAVVNGNPAISYHDATSGTLRYLRATNSNGTVWDAALTLDNELVTGQYTSLTVLIAGNAAISYYDFSRGDLRFAWEF